jgi:fructose-1,6-bisphosphatase I
MQSPHPGASAAGQTLASVLHQELGGEAGQPALTDVLATLVATTSDVAGLVAQGQLDTYGGPSAPAQRNASGDRQTSLDVAAQDLFVSALAQCPVAAVGSEETGPAITLNAGAPFVVTLDPIDGSSNIDINAPVGSIFSVLPTTGFENDSPAALLQPGRRQLAAGFVVYGPRTVMALTWGNGTDIYAWHPGAEEFVRIQRCVQLPADAQEYAINASNARHWDSGIRAYVSDLVNGSMGPRERDFNMRWLAALVAEAYRILLRGGIYLYPADARPAYRHGRIRMVYEANPVALLCEQAGGAATDGFRRILDLTPATLHETTPFVFGSSTKVDRVRRYLEDPPTRHEASPLFSERGLLRR